MRLKLPLFLLLFCTFSEAFAQSPIHVACAFRPPQSTFFKAILEHTFKRLGRSIIFTEMPAERGVQMANQGLIDAECGRVAEIEDLYPNVIRISENIGNVEFTAFTKNPEIIIKGWAELKPYNVATILGWKLAEVNLAKVKPSHYIALPSIPALFKMLDSQRIDIAVLGKVAGLKALSDLGITGIKAQTPPLSAVPLYFFLHKKHLNLVDPVRKIFAEMKADGSWQRIFNSVSQ